MGVYINMEMPGSCDECILNNGITCYAVPDYKEDGVVGRTDDRPDWCPLVPVPTHGRLGDLDRLAKEVKDMAKEFPPDSIGAERYRLFAEFIKTAPTIIEAEEGET